MTFDHLHKFAFGLDFDTMFVLCSEPSVTRLMHDFPLRRKLSSAV